jgi:DNA-directed RNA polymerase beta subunit
MILSIQLTLMEKNVFQHCVYIASDGGRVCRPLVIADKGISRIKEHHMKELMVSLIFASCPK